MNSSIASRVGKKGGSLLLDLRIQQLKAPPLRRPMAIAIFSWTSCGEKRGSSFELRIPNLQSLYDLPWSSQGVVFWLLMMSVSSGWNRDGLFADFGVFHFAIFASWILVQSSIGLLRSILNLCEMIEMHLLLFLKLSLNSVKGLLNILLLCLKTFFVILSKLSQLISIAVILCWFDIDRVLSVTKYSGKPPRIKQVFSQGGLATKIRQSYGSPKDVSPLQ